MDSRIKLIPLEFLKDVQDLLTKKAADFVYYVKRFLMDKMIIQKTIVKVVKTYDTSIVTLVQQVASSVVTNGCCSRLQREH